MPKLIGVLGPLVAAIGAAILVVDALRGPVRWYEFIDWPRARLKVENEQHKRFLRRLKELPATYPEDERQRLIEHEFERHEKTIDNDQETIAKADLKERLHTFNLAFWGFGLIAVGSIMQSLAALFAK
jgi:hypothetical protein